MVPRQVRGLVQQYGGYLIALGAIVATTVLIGLILGYQRVGNLTLLYLLPILVVAIRVGRGPAIVATLAAFLAFDWFFVEPFHRFTIADPAEWLALALFLVTATVTAQLAARERARAEEALYREREVTLTGRIAALIGEADDDPARGCREVERALAEALPLATVRIVLESGAATPMGATASDGAALTQTYDLLSGEGQRLGWLTVGRAAEAAFTVLEQRLLTAVAASLGAALERAQLRAVANEAETLRRTDELKDTLLNAVSHDLRTPLAAILAAAESLQQRDVAWTEEDRQEFVAAIAEEAQRLNRIVGNLLDLSRIEAGSLRPDRAWHDLGTLIEDVIARAQVRYPHHGFVVELPPELPPLFIDAVELDQVLWNLIENAAKYAPPETKVWVHVGLAREEVRVQVADRGPGLPDEALRQLFTPFYRVQRRGRGPGPAGIGLGLAVARGLIEAHGGQIWAKNRDGGGAIFAFSLPLLADPHSDALEAVASGGQAQ